MREKNKSVYISCGRQDCGDMHSWGPGVRTSYIIHYIVRGKGIFVCNSKTYFISAGQSFVIRPFSEVYYRPDEKDPWEYAWIDFNGEEYVRLLNKTDFFEGDCVIGKVEPDKILGFYQALLVLHSHNNNYYTADGLARTILGIYADSYPASAHKSEESCFEAARIMIIGFSHKPEFGLPDICENLGVSRATLHRSFKKNCGISPGAYLLNYRIDIARELLEHGSSVKSTALSCGFQNPLYFSKAFKESVGVPPREYRGRYVKK